MSSSKKNKHIILGIDVGATGIKGALVDVIKCALVTGRIKIPTPKPAIPKNVVEVIKILIQKFNYNGLIGCGFPSVMIDGVCRTAANIDKSWIGFEAEKFFTQKTGQHFTVVNDADAAGVAELLFGTAKGAKGTVILLTLGTGIGSALLIDGKLVPNTEFGHLKYKKSIAENYVSNRARKELELSYEQWGRDLSHFLNHLEFIFTPNMIILGGGVSKRYAQFGDFIKTDCKVVSASIFNDAGIVGAAVHAYQKNRE